MLCDSHYIFPPFLPPRVRRDTSVSRRAGVGVGAGARAHAARRHDAAPATPATHTRALVLGAGAGLVPAEVPRPPCLGPGARLLGYAHCFPD